MKKLKLDKYGIHEVLYSGKKTIVLYANFEKDYYTWKKIPTERYKKRLKMQRPIKKVFYISEIADVYYQEKYGKNILEVLDEYYDVPRCLITGEYLTYSCCGYIRFGKFGKSYVWNKGKNKHNNNIIKTMASNRLGKNNPMYNKDPWNKGLTKETNSSVKKVSDKKKGKRLTEEHKKNLSKSAKERNFDGHTGCKHSDKTKIKISISKGGDGDLKRIKDRKRIVWDDIRWRDQILFRDLYTCLVCGKKKYVEAHHIKPKAKYPNHRHDLDNGITLCLRCHKKTYQDAYKYEKKFKDLLLKKYGGTDEQV